MFMIAYRFMDQLWQRIEIILTVTILTTMTLATFAYTMMNNFYSFFYYLAEKFPFADQFFMVIGDILLDATYAMSWSNAFTKACFAWLIFFCMSYGVRVGGHIGVDALMKLLNTKTQRFFAYIGLGACLLYATLLLMASLEWVYTFFLLKTEAQDLYQLYILKWHITVMVPIGFILLIMRYLEIGYRLLTHQQNGLGLADEVKDAVNETLHGLKG